jgi:hypothetical protein
MGKPWANVGSFMGNSWLQATSLLEFSDSKVVQLIGLLYFKLGGWRS